MLVLQQRVFSVGHVKRTSMFVQREHVHAYGIDARGKGGEEDLPTKTPILMIVTRVGWR